MITEQQTILGRQLHHPHCPRFIIWFNPGISSWVTSCLTKLISTTTIFKEFCFQEKRIQAGSVKQKKRALRFSTNSDSQSATYGTVEWVDDGRVHLENMSWCPYLPWTEDNGVSDLGLDKNKLNLRAGQEAH